MNENRKKEMTYLMFQCLNAAQIIDNVGMNDLKDLSWMIDQNLKQIERRIDETQAEEVVANHAENVIVREQGMENNVDAMQSQHWPLDFTNNNFDIQPCIFANLGTTIHSIQKDQNLTTSKPCNTYTFPNDLNYATCNDLPVLESSLHWNYYPKTNKVDIAFKKNNAKDSSWIAWAINPDSKGYDRITSPNRLSEIRWKFQSIYIVYNKLCNYVTRGNTSLFNHVWQEGLVSNDGSLRAHAMTGPNVQSFGTLDFKSGIVSKNKNVGGKLKSRTILRNVHGILNAISWGTLMPIGVILARYLKSFDGSIGPVWFHLHRACQSIALVIGTIGFGTGLYMGNQPGQHDTPHRCAGITLMTLAFTQVCVAFCLRPKKDHKVKGIDVMWRNIYAWVIGLLGLTVFCLEVVTWISLWIKKEKKIQELDV
ncbi:hypothetical protein TSUD_132000 [Trifolium subterraneum]|uniref:Cytochrome b561 domain-containing protein n=1 Tax=Trifolium subterraneum TaxID=3900 RepID=A0A2Z6LV29_TRISU|nr:hypothetical protein TSUD_132000 [Trifolium subterraneum]